MCTLNMETCIKTAEMWISELFIDQLGCMVLSAFLLIHLHSLQCICADVG